LTVAVHSRRAAYAALAILGCIWGLNWLVMKAALAHSHPLSFNVQRTWLATLVLFAVLIARRRHFWPHSWRAVAVTAFFQTAINFGATTMAVALGGAGRTSVLVYTMPFWTIVIAWPVLHERVRGLQAAAVVFAFAGLLLVVQPWSWSGDLTPKLWAVLSGFGWAAGTVAMKYFQRERGFDMLSFIAWQMLIGVVPLTVLPFAFDVPATQWSVLQVVYLVLVGIGATAGGFLLWMEILRWLPAGTASLNMFAVPVVALVASMVVYGERLTELEWLGIALIAAGLILIALQAVRLGRRGSPLPATPAPLD
jgi:drug/metabolite transporter (DMT)-like permease